MEEHRYAEQLLARLREWADCSERIKAQYRTPALPASYSSATGISADGVPPNVSELYTHQHQTVERALRGESVTVATATASGKTLAMALSGSIHRRADPSSTLLCIAPTRALIEQWRERLTEWNPGVCVMSYSSDTKEQVKLHRSRIQVLITTPDMLHCGLLPYHQYWSRLLAHLQDVIIDESHVYYGFFGSHFSLVLRRLQRVVALYRKTSPVYLFGSATIGNPDEHAGHLLGSPVAAITQSGAPTGGRLTLLWQPPERRSATEEAAGLMAFCLREQRRAILFGQHRQTVERMLRMVRSRLPVHLRDRVVAYRAGYLKEDRLAIEHRLANGDLLGVISTSALEIGIDLGDLDVSIIAGFPGSVSSYLQQAGRAGRRSRSALSILVLRQNALDQYFALHPEMLLDAPAERAQINPGNPYILPAHLLCAAIETHLTQADHALFGLAAAKEIENLLAQGDLIARQGRLFPRKKDPGLAHQVYLRQPGRQLLMLADGCKVEENMDMYHAVVECYPGAIYLSQGASYEVLELNRDASRIELRERETNYYTVPLGQTHVEILLVEQQHHRDFLDLFVGQAIVTRTTVGYHKKHHVSHEVLEQCKLTEGLCEQMETKACWMIVHSDLLAQLIKEEYDPLAAMHAAEHAMIAFLPLFVKGDSRDNGGVSMLSHPQTEQPTIFIYDGYPGGIGNAEEAYRQWEALAQAALSTLQKCPCDNGCSACVMSPRCGSGNHALDKHGAICLLQAWLATQVNRSEETLSCDG